MQPGADLMLSAEPQDLRVCGARQGLGTLRTLCAGLHVALPPVSLCRQRNKLMPYHLILSHQGFQVFGSCLQAYRAHWTIRGHLHNVVYLSERVSSHSSECTRCSLLHNLHTMVVL